MSDEFVREIVRVQCSSFSTNTSSGMENGSSREEFPGARVKVPTSITKSASEIQERANQ